MCRRQGPHRRRRLLTYVNYPADRVSRAPTASTSARSTSTCTAKPTCAHTWRDCNRSPARVRCCWRRRAPTASARGPTGRPRSPRCTSARRSRKALCGAVAFSWTDEWWRGGHAVEDWAFGLVDARSAAEAGAGGGQRGVRRGAVPGSAQANWPKVSVVVCAYNAADTLDDCLDSLGASTIPTSRSSSSMTARGIAPATSPGDTRVRLIDIPNGGLSAARNIGLAAATGEIVAYTDADVRVDRDWLTYLVQPFLTSDVVGSGGPNVVPPDDPCVAQCVARAPGGPTHVLLDDRIAEHVPGCNMAFRREALLAIDGFNPVYLRAGDDVDVCWRLQAKSSGLASRRRRSCGTTIGRRSRRTGASRSATAKARRGSRPTIPRSSYDGSMLWRGRIYSPLPFIRSLSRRRVNTGVWGTAPFPSVYSTSVHRSATAAAFARMASALDARSHCGRQRLCQRLHRLTVAASGRRSRLAHDRCALPEVWLALGSRGVASVRGVSSRVGHRVLIAWLHFLQPLARFTGRIRGKWSPPQTIDPARAMRLTWKAPIARSVRHPCIGASPDRRRASGALLERDVDLVGCSAHRTDGPAARVAPGARRPGRRRFPRRSRLERQRGQMGMAGCAFVARRARRRTMPLARCASPAYDDAGSCAGAEPDARLVCRAQYCPRMGRHRCRARCRPRHRPCRVANELGGLGSEGGHRAGGVHSRDDADSTAYASAFASGFQSARRVVRSTCTGNGARAARRGRGGQRRVPLAGHRTTTDRVADRSRRCCGSESSLHEDAADRGRHRVASNGDLLFADARRGVIHHFAMAALNEPARVTATVSDSDDQQVLSWIGASIRQRRWPSDLTATCTSPTPEPPGQPDQWRLWRDRDARRVGREAAFDGDLKPAVNAALNTPNGIAVAANGNIYIADSGNNRIRMISAATGLIHTIAGTGDTGPPDADDIALGDGGHDQRVPRRPPSAVPES